MPADPSEASGPAGVLAGCRLEAEALVRGGDTASMPAFVPRTVPPPAPASPVPSRKYQNRESAIFCYGKICAILKF